MKIMYKWMYDRMVAEYSKETKEELVHRIMSLEEIECEDRCFANQCQAGISVYEMNNLFGLLENLKKCVNNPNSTNEDIVNCTKAFCSETENTSRSWNYIRNGLGKINDDTRCGKKLENFKKRVSKARYVNDSI